jgi:hypothetical protein
MNHIEPAWAQAVEDVLLISAGKEPPTIYGKPTVVPQ